MYFGSDAIALAPFTDTISYLEDGDWAVLTRSGVQIFDEQDRPVERPVDEVERHRACWSTRATTSISWPRKSMNSRKWSAIRWRTTST